MKSRVKKYTLNTFPNHFNKPTVLLFTRKTCHYCKKLKPIYENVSKIERFLEIYDFRVIDADDEIMIYHKFQANGVPTMYVLYEQDGVEVPYSQNPESGYGEEDIIKFLDELMEQS